MEKMIILEQLLTELSDNPLNDAEQEIKQNQQPVQNQLQKPQQSINNRQPNDPNMMGGDPNIAGAMPNDPNMMGAMPNDPNMIGNDPNMEPEEPIEVKNKNYHDLTNILSYITYIENQLNIENIESVEIRKNVTKLKTYLDLFTKNYKQFEEDKRSNIIDQFKTAIKEINKKYEILSNTLSNKANLKDHNKRRNNL
jgi:hypothetical protein